uniref:Uncharacterized protein n=1 Tax=Tanacetum cinerariifolium TaxID=118510 RepID=A0A699GZU2_TANCI|nr:hypothetical protein [Tanacetum cinerariifolium]
MNIQDEIAGSKGKSKVDSSSTQVDDAIDVVKPKPKPAPVKPKSKDVIKPKLKPAVKQSVGKRKRSIDEVVLDVLDDLNVASGEGEDYEDSFDENVASYEKDDGDNEVGSVEKDNIVGDGDSDEEDEEYEAKEKEKPLIKKKNEAKKGK